MTVIIKSVEASKREFKPGEVIFRENDKSGSFFIVKKGTVQVFKNHGKPGQVLLAEIEQGRVLGEVSALDGHLRSATAVAKSEVEVAAVSADTLAYQLKQCPGWFQAVVLDLVERLRHTNDLFSEKGMESPHTHSSGKVTDQES